MRLKDSEVDYSDIPELGEEFFKHAKVVRPGPKTVSTSQHLTKGSPIALTKKHNA
jgi:hypothetical protein